MNMKNPWVLIGIITVVLFGGAIWYSNVASSQNNEGVVIADHIKGNSEGQVTLVEYSDFQCPACAAFYPVAKEVMDAYGDSIRFEYKHFPLVAAHPFATQAAIAAEAAGQQGKFFEFHDKLFENQQTWSSSQTPTVYFLQYADELGLDISTFKRHLNSSLLAEKVRTDFNEGRELNVNATPSFYLNGEFMNPDEFQTYQGFIEQIAVAVDPANAATSSDETVVGEQTGATVKFGL